MTPQMMTPQMIADALESWLACDRDDGSSDLQRTARRTELRALDAEARRRMIACVVGVAPSEQADVS